MGGSIKIDFCHFEMTCECTGLLWTRVEINMTHPTIITDCAFHDTCFAVELYYIDNTVSFKLCLIGRIPTVQLKIPGKSMAKSGSRTSVAKSQSLPLVDS